MYSSAIAPCLVLSQRGLTFFSCTEKTTLSLGLDLLVTAMMMPDYVVSVVAEGCFI